jgi:choice-of-anchor A domain-containing protein
MMLLPATTARGGFEAHPMMKGSSLMKIAIDSCTQSTARAGGGAHSRTVSGAVALFAFAVFAATPSFCHAQVTGLGSAASYGLLEDGGSVNVKGFLSFNSSGVQGNIGLQSATVNVGLSDSLSVNGTAYEGSGVTINANGFLQGSFSANSIVKGQQSALAAAFTAATSASSNDKALASTTTISSNVITGTQAVNVVNVSSISHDLTISGSANQVFVINVTGNSGIKLSNVMLSGGVTAKDVLFNITGKGGVSLGKGTVNGTFLVTGSGSVSLNGTTVDGEIIAGKVGVTTTSATINAEPFGGGAAVAAPELPSIAMAGAACLLLLGRAAVARIKRSRAS